MKRYYFIFFVFIFIIGKRANGVVPAIYRERIADPGLSGKQLSKIIINFIMENPSQPWIRKHGMKIIRIFTVPPRFLFGAGHILRYLQGLSVTHMVLGESGMV